MNRGDDAVGLRGEDWWNYHKLCNGTREQRVDLEQESSPTAKAAQNAFDHVQEVVESGGPEAISMIVELLDSAPDLDSVGTVGAGPLEDLVHDHGPELIDELERLARQVPAFSLALASVWLEHGALPADVEARLALWVRVSGYE